MSLRGWSAALLCRSPCACPCSPAHRVSGQWSVRVPYPRQLRSKCHELVRAPQLAYETGGQRGVRTVYKMACNLPRVRSNPACTSMRSSEIFLTWLISRQEGVEAFCEATLRITFGLQWLWQHRSLDHEGTATPARKRGRVNLNGDVFVACLPAMTCLLKSVCEI